ncbi:MAG: TPM domain-containing protein, partial [Clostridiales bacterium]|nr:TPM domain-containing protein [Clostridiales bacterium]
WIWIAVSIAAGFVIALIIVGSMKSKLKMVRFQAGANSYLRQGSMNVTESRDLFLYRHVSRTAKPKSSSSGSSTHSSSSGRSHGGGGGKY